MTGMFHKFTASTALLIITAGSVHALETEAKVDLTPEYLAQNITPSYEEGGRWFTEDDVPTYEIEENGDLDWPSYSGYRRFNAECFQCHGPDGDGSTYAPAIKNSALELDYYDFVDTVVNGKQNVSNSENLVMPAFGTNVNVMCYLDDIYVYLKGRGMGDIPRGRPSGRVDKSDDIREAENSCLGIE